MVYHSLAFKYRQPIVAIKTDVIFIIFFTDFLSSRNDFSLNKFTYFCTIIRPNRFIKQTIFTQLRNLLLEILFSYRHRKLGTFLLQILRISLTDLSWLLDKNLWSQIKQIVFQGKILQNLLEICRKVVQEEILQWLNITQYK